MASPLELKVLFSAVDKFVSPVKAITGAAKDAAKAMRDNTTKKQELDRTLAKIDAYEKLVNQTKGVSASFHATKDKLAALKHEIDMAGVPTDKQARKLANLTKKQELLSKQLQNLHGSEIDLRTALHLSGIETDKLADARKNLASASAAAEMNSRRLQTALDAENEKMRRVRAAEAELRKSREKAGKIAAAGAGMTAAGAAVSLPVGKSVKDFADFETAMLGVARQMDGARDENGKVTKSYWEMASAIKAMSERLPGTANDIAKIVEGGARMGIQGKENLLIYAETTAVMASAFDLPVEKVGEDIGKISQLYKVPIKDIAALGDTINYLDDNALAKGGEIIDVMKRIAGTADMAKMSFKDAAALGSTFLSLGANPEVAASASNAMIRELAVANMQSKRFKEGMAMIGMDGKTVQKGMSTDATGTIIKVLEKIKGLAGDKQLEAATRLFGKEYGDDASKLAANLDEYRRQLKLVNDERARGSMKRENDSRSDTLNARIENAKDAFTNLSSDLGKSLKPAIADTLEKTLGMIQGIRDWAAEHPRLAGGLMTTVKWLAIILTTLGLLTTAAGLILFPLAATKFAFITLGISGSGALGMLTTALSFVGGAIRLVTGALLMNPIGLTLTAIAVAAFLIYKNWDKLGPWLASLIERIGNYFSGLKDTAINAGRDFINGLITGINEKWESLKAKVGAVSDSTVEWLKEKLGIHSPSRVFAEIGGHLMGGWAKGIEDNAGSPLDALGVAAKKLVSAGAGVVIAAGSAPAMAAQGGQALASSNTYQINIHPSPGLDERAIADLVARKIEEIESRKQRARRGQLRDQE